MKLMRLRHAKLIVIIIVIINLILFYYSWKSTLWKSIATTLTLPHLKSNAFNNFASSPQNVKVSSKDKVRNTYKHIRKSMTIVFRNFYTFENDLKESIDNILDVVPNVPIVVYQDSIPYPPIIYERNSSSRTDNFSTIRFVNLGYDIMKTPIELNPLSIIQTKYVLFLPDSVRFSGKNLLQKILREINTNTWDIDKRTFEGNNNNNNKGKNKLNTLPENVVRRIIIVPFAGNLKSFAGCVQVTLDMPNWTIQYTAVNSSSDKCDLYLQKHAFLVDIGVLNKMPDPLSLPFPEMFYIQAKLSNITKFVFPQSFQDGRRLFVAYHTKQRRMDMRRRQFRDMYKKLQIKRIVRRAHKPSLRADLKDSNSLQHNIVLDTQFSSANFSMPFVTEIDLIGCERTTKSCINTVYNQKPFYTYLGKHTPPCCLDKLKSTFNHILEEFENVGIRYWLDNMALKTAIETNQLSPDAYDIDISFNVDDLERSNAMKKSQNKPYADNEGFYWIKATDGHYFRVQFSKINQIGVNLLPFEINGNEVKANGFFGWKAKSFSADFLHPMSTVIFLGKNIMCPNNVREYLDVKNIH